MLSLGRKGEAKAARYLKRHGYRILSLNYKSPSGEIDIVAMDGETLVFVEVKARSSDAFGSPSEAVDRKKRHKISGAALHYMSGLERQPPARFDVVGISFSTWRCKVDHIKDAFSLE